jgi:putative tricarboxylic transport membrane protein
MRRVTMAAVLALALAAVVAGCGNKADTSGGGGGGGGAANWPDRDLRLMAPADPGGGWDGTARAMSQAMTEAKVIDKGVEVYNVPGAGGTIGLSQLASKYSGKSNELMVMGLVMMGAIETNKSPTDLSKTTPIAALTTEPEAVFVKADSKYKTMQDLVDDMKADPAKISVGGGSAGGTDQILLGLIAKAAGVDPSKPKYVAYSGGGEAQQSILSGSVDAGISAISEWVDQVAAGKMRVLAVSTAEPIEVAGKEVKTLKDQGLDVEITNWRGVVAPPDIKPADREAAIAAMQKLHDSPQWKQMLEKNEWTDFFKTGDDFDSFLKTESTRVKGVLQDIGLTG